MRPSRCGVNDLHHTSYLIGNGLRVVSKHRFSAHVFDGLQLAANLMAELSQLCEMRCDLMEGMQVRQ